MTSDQTSVQVSNKISTPFTHLDYHEIDNLCTVLVGHCDNTRQASPSVYARNTCEDIIAMLTDLQIDMRDFGKQHGREIEDDGFVTV